MGIDVDSDFLLIQKMRLGDEKAVECFVTKYYPAILRYCRIHIQDYGYAQDMTQETFARFFQTFQRYKHYGKAVNYLYVIAANVCRDYHRKKKEVPLEQMPEREDESRGQAEEKMIISEAFGLLPEELRETAVLYFIEERRQKDIAEILGIGEPLVKYRVRRAREILISCLGKEEL